MNKNKIIEILENFAPLSLCEPWDNSGWQIKTDKEEINSVLLCVSPTQNVVEQAVNENIDMIIAHHPLIFPFIKCIEDDVIETAIKNNIPIYSAHTNFDKAGDGTSGELAKTLGFNQFTNFNEYVKITTLETGVKIDDLVLKTKISLNIEKLKIIGYRADKVINKIAFCAGSGRDFIYDLNDSDIDLFITSDIKYHDELKIANYVIFDTGHLESERPSLKKFVQLLDNNGLKIVIANEKTNKKYL